MKALWQAGPLVEPTVSGGLVLGLNLRPKPSELEAVSERTGTRVWSAPVSRLEPEVLGMFASGGAAVVEIGHEVGHAPAGVFAVATGIAVFNEHTGKRLWEIDHQARAERRSEHMPLAYSQGVVVMAGASGGLIARKARSGALAWRLGAPLCARRRPGEHGFVNGLAADGGLLVASYRCSSQREAVIERVDPETGRLVWRRRMPALRPKSSMTMSVTAAATRGQIVLLSAQLVPPPTAHRYAQRLPSPHAWPRSLGAIGDDELLVALDARSGRPRWTEFGGQLERVTLADGLVCEMVKVGFECRDDASGKQSRPVMLTDYGEADSPPYVGDGYAGISGHVAGVVYAHAQNGAVSVRVLPLRGKGLIAQAQVNVHSGGVAGESYSAFIVGAGPTARGGTLLLLRRVDMRENPLLALSVSARR